VKPRTVRKKVVTPFTTEEIHHILGYFQEHHQTYAPFVSFLFMTGCRTSEAIGLQWKRVNFGRGELIIEDALPISAVTGKPRRKGTKTNSVTVLDMTPELQDLLTRVKTEAPEHGRGTEPEDLIFYSPEGCVIHRSNFWGIWSKVLKQLGISHRKPYTTRHTMASHAIEQGTPLTGVAYLLGHKDTRMVSQTYGHMVNRPTLPKLVTFNA
jgi:integrase